MKKRDKEYVFRKAILDWGNKYKRSFPWRTISPDPYMVLLSEMLLRKTQAESVAPVFNVVCQKYPTIFELNNADQKHIEELIKPIGLFRIRSKALMDVANIICKNHNGIIPNTYDELIILPHVGRYAANAILCFAFDKPLAIVDTNVVRILSRVFSIPLPIEVHKAENYWSLAQKLLPNKNYQEFNLALLDLGAIICTPGIPKCNECPLNIICEYHSSGVDAKLENME